MHRLWGSETEGETMTKAELAIAYAQEVKKRCELEVLLEKLRRGFLGVKAVRCARHYEAREDGDLTILLTAQEWDRLVESSRKLADHFNENWDY